MIELAPHPELHPVFEGLGFVLGYAVYRHARRHSTDLLNDQQRWTIIAAAAVAGMVGSRLLGLLEQQPLTQITLSQLLIPSGGMTIVGGLLGGWLGVEITKKLSGIETRTGDVFGIPLCVGIAVGRIGCLLAGLADDTYGTPTSLPWGLDFGDGVARHPTQAYEIVFLISLALALRYLKRLLHSNGALFRAFMVAYLTWRLLIDFLKPEPLIAGLSVIQWACVTGLVLLIAAWKGLASTMKPRAGREYAEF